MSLEPGDRRIQRVRPWFGEETRTGWSCSRCERGTRAGRSWLVEYRDEHSDMATFVVCGDCAQDLIPRRLTIDLATMRRSEVPDDLAPLVRLVDFVLTHRRQVPTDELRLRSSDVHVLTKTYGTSSAHFAMRLRDEGLLVGL